MTPPLWIRLEFKFRDVNKGTGKRCRRMKSGHQTNQPSRSAAVHVCMYCTVYRYTHTLHTCAEHVLYNVHTHARTYRLHWTHMNCRLSIKLTRIFSHLANASRGCGRFAGFWGSFPLWKLLGENLVGIAAFLSVFLTVIPTELRSTIAGSGRCIGPSIEWSRPISPG